MRRSLVAALLLLLALPAAAQFYSQGSEPAGVRWRQITTPDYRVLFPEGLDSLARVYADLLERVKYPVGATAGYYPNQEYRKPLPVILHAGTSHSNGMVAWTPRRMELFTTPDYSPHDSYPWPEHLVTHESRHVAQMQFVNAKPYRPYSWFVGELFAGAASSIYGESAFYEGDAVTAETELSSAGRGRNAAFLEYYRTAFRNGDMRNYWQWRYGSIKKYTPDYYTVGYIRSAGMRSVYGAQDFTAQYYGRIFRKSWPWPFFNYQKTVKEVSGKKDKEAFAEICDTLRQRWHRDELARAPFMPSEQLTPKARRHIEYTSPVWLDSTLFAIRSGLEYTPELVTVAPDGTVRALSRFSYGTSRLRPSEALQRLYWSEIVYDERWELKSYSEIWYCGTDGWHHRLSRRTRWYNPSVSPDGWRLAVAEYPVQGGSSLLVLDAVNGDIQARYDAPSGLQIIESAWIGERLLVSGIDANCFGIFDATDGFRLLLDCGRANIKDLKVFDDRLFFTADLTGVDELYRMGDGIAERLTSSVQGGIDYAVKADKLVFSALGPNGRHLMETPSEELPAPVRADFGTPHRYELAEDLEAPLPIDRDSVIVIPESQKYNRLAHLFRFHSWAPVYVSPDAVSDLSFDNLFSSVSLGATAFFQNELETMTGSVAYGAFVDSKGHWSHLGETKFTYSGLYPKIEASLSIDSDPASSYFLQLGYTSFSRRLSFAWQDLTGTPGLDASVLVYVPLSFSSGGWYRGLVPQVRAGLSNSLVIHGSVVPMNRVSASLRGYVISGTAPSAIYPRLGFGMEAGLSGRIGATDLFAPNAYVYAYGYLPGLMRTHGVKLTATAQMPQGEYLFTERYVSVLPRGMSSYGSLATNVSAYPVQSRATFDYAFPFLPLDWGGMSPVAYVRNLECTLHADASWFGGGIGGDSLTLAGVGTDLCVVLGNLAWLPFTTRVGVSAWWNFGAPEEFKPYHIGFVFNMDI